MSSLESIKGSSLPDIHKSKELQIRGSTEKDEKIEKKVQIEESPEEEEKPEEKVAINSLPQCLKVKPKPKTILKYVKPC